MEIASKSSRKIRFYRTDGTKRQFLYFSFVVTTFQGNVVSEVYCRFEKCFVMKIDLVRKFVSEIVPEFRSSDFLFVRYVFLSANGDVLLFLVYDVLG